MILAVTLTDLFAVAQLTDLPYKDVPPVIDSNETWSVANVTGRPTLVRNGMPVTPLFYYNRGYTVDAVSNGLAHLMSQAGMKMYVMDCALNWGNDTHYVLAERINAVLKIDPDAKILLRLYLWAPKIWTQSNHDEIVQLEDGSLYGGPFSATSYASKKWIDQICARIDNVFLYMKLKGVYDKVIGVITCAGGTGEWNLWTYQPYSKTAKTPSAPTPLADYSPAMKNYYAAWLSKKYGDIESLNKTYASSYKRFSEVKIPDEKTLRGYSSESSWFRSPSDSKTKYAQDYFYAYSEAVTDAMLTFTERIYKITNGKRLVGVWFGQAVQASYGGSWGLFKNAYLCEQQVLNSESINLVMTPPLYISTYLGGSAGMQNFPSVWQDHGKLCLYEMDHPTHLLYERFTPDQWVHNDMKSTYWGRNGKPYQHRRLPKNMEESLAILRRAFGYCLIDGIAIQFWDMEGSKRGLPRGVIYDDPQILAEFGHMNRIYRQSVKMPRQSVAEIAVIYDNTAYKYIKPSGASDTQVDLLASHQDTYNCQLESLARCGATFDVHYLSDVVNLRPYKLYIFLNAWHLSENDKVMIHKKLEKEKATALWFYAPGYVQDNALDLAGIKDVTGFALKIRTPGKGKMTKAESADMCGFNVASVSKLNPNFEVEPEKDVQIWGIDPQTKAPLAASRNMPGGWRSMYTAVTPLPDRVLMEIAKQSGVHIWTGKPGLIIRANESYLMIHGSKAGIFEILLPQKTKVIDPYTNDVINKAAKSFTIHTEGPFTKIYKLESQDD